MNPCVEDEVQQHLLELDPVPEHLRQGGPQLSLDRHATLDQVAVDQLEHFRHDFVEVETAGWLDIAFPEQRTEAVDNVPRPPVVVNDVLEDLAQLGYVQRAVAEQMLRRPGVGEDRGERLVQLVREGAGQLTQHRHAAEVRHLVPLLLRFGFGAHSRGDVPHEGDETGLSGHLHGVRGQRRLEERSGSGP